MPMDLEQPSEIVLFEQMAEAALRGLVGHRLAPQIDADETTHRLRSVECLLDRRFRQVEPLLQRPGVLTPR
jgi:hypothetical protein